jgi:uncharacterized protein YdiU (UPF0061 family)
MWNLHKLALALGPTLDDKKKQSQFDVVLDTYKATYQKHFTELFRAKLGLKSSSEPLDDMKLAASLLAAMETKYADFTQTFRDLSEISLEDLNAKKIPETAWGLIK